MSDVDLKIRKEIVTTEVIRLEAGRPVPKELMIVVAAVVIENPWAGQGFVEDLKSTIHRLAPHLGRTLTDNVVKPFDGKEIEAYGKGSIVGLGGEMEHASALIHTLRFGNVYRERVSGTSFLPFTNRRAVAGSTLVMPLVHKADTGFRTHYLTADLTLPDAPNDNELVIALGAASGPRPFARIGDRYEDMDAMGLKP